VGTGVLIPVSMEVATATSLPSGPSAALLCVQGPRHIKYAGGGSSSGRVWGSPGWPRAAWFVRGMERWGVEGAWCVRGVGCMCVPCGSDSALSC
jgi:hypothetical protein